MMAISVVGLLILVGGAALLLFIAMSLLGSQDHSGFARLLLVVFAIGALLTVVKVSRQARHSAVDVVPGHVVAEVPLLRALPSDGEQRAVVATLDAASTPGAASEAAHSLGEHRAGGDAMQHEVVMNWSWISLLLAIGAVLFLISLVRGLVFDSPRHRPGGFRILAGTMAIAMVVAGAGFFYLGAPRRAVLQSQWPTSPPQLQDSVCDPTLESLWDKLTKARIDLGDEAAGPIADPADETVKEVVGETFGLDAKGELPPKWVVNPPKWVGQVYRETVTSDPFVSDDECRRQLEQEQLPQAVARRIEQIASAKAGGQVVIGSPLSLGIGPDYILREICRDEFTGSIESSVGDMKKVHVLLEFDENVDNHLLDAWLRHERNRRLTSLGEIAALSLTGLAAIYGLLRFDTWSKGYYSKQLLVGGTLAIIALAVFLLQT